MVGAGYGLLPVIRGLSDCALTDVIFLLDPRVEDWLLMSSPLPQTIILGLYVYFVTSLGPKLMENRKPFELRKAMITYNFFIVLFSVYMCYEASVFSIPNGKSLPESFVYMSVCFCYDYGALSPPLFFIIDEFRN